MDVKLMEEFDRHQVICSFTYNLAVSCIYLVIAFHGLLQDLHSSAHYILTGVNQAFCFWIDMLTIVFLFAVTFGFLIGGRLGTYCDKLST